MAITETMATLEVHRAGRRRRRRGLLSVGLLAAAIAACTSSTGTSNSNVTIDAAVFAGKPEPGAFDRTRAQRFTSALGGRGSIKIDLIDVPLALREGRLVVKLATIQGLATLRLDPMVGEEASVSERELDKDLGSPSFVQLELPVALEDGTEVVVSIGLGAEAVIADRAAQVLALAPNRGARLLLLDNGSGEHQHDSGILLAFEASDGSVHQAPGSGLGVDVPDLAGLGLDDLAGQLRSF